MENSCAKPQFQYRGCCLNKSKSAADCNGVTFCLHLLSIPITRFILTLTMECLLQAPPGLSRADFKEVNQQQTAHSDTQSALV
jgi:hypothetical protein